MKLHSLSSQTRSLPVLIATAATLISGTITLSGCAGLGDLMKSPTARIESVDITGLNFTGVSLQVNLAVDNPNPIGLTLSAYDWELGLAGKRILGGRQEQGAALKASGRSTIPIPLTLTFADLAAAGSALAGAQDIPLSVALGLEIAMPYMPTLRLDLSAEVEIPVLRPPVLLPSGIRVETLSLNEARIVITLSASNPNTRDLSIDRAGGVLTVGGREWGRIELSGSGRIPGRGTAVLEIRTRVDFVQAGRTAWSILSGTGGADVDVNGSMDVGMDLPAFNGRGLDWNADAKVSIVR